MDKTEPFKVDEEHLKINLIALTVYSGIAKKMAKEAAELGNEIASASWYGCEARANNLIEGYKELYDSFKGLPGEFIGVVTKDV